jgi:phage pi2 protein 07
MGENRFGYVNIPLLYINSRVFSVCVKLGFFGVDSKFVGWTVKSKNWQLSDRDNICMPSLRLKRKRKKKLLPVEFEGFLYFDNNKKKIWLFIPQSSCKIKWRNLEQWQNRQ